MSLTVIKESKGPLYAGRIKIALKAIVYRHIIGRAREKQKGNGKKREKGSGHYDILVKVNPALENQRKN